MLLFGVEDFFVRGWSNYKSGEKVRIMAASYRLNAIFSKQADMNRHEPTLGDKASEILNYVRCIEIPTNRHEPTPAHTNRNGNRQDSAK